MIQNTHQLLALEFEPITGLTGYQPGDSIISATDSLSSLISNIVGLLTIVAGIAFLIYFTIGGITWITAGGDKGKTQEAQNRMTGGAIGMIIVVAAWAISWIIGQILGIDFLNPGNTIKNLGPQGEVVEESSSNTGENGLLPITKPNDLQDQIE